MTVCPGGPTVDIVSLAKVAVPRRASRFGGIESPAPLDNASRWLAHRRSRRPAQVPCRPGSLASATDYLDYSAFSQSGLVEQLTFEGYSKKDAEFAASNVGANWKKQAVASAEDYLSYSSFSKAGLIEQLTFEGYTQAQAVYGANQAY